MAMFRAAALALLCIVLFASCAQAAPIIGYVQEPCPGSEGMKEEYRFGKPVEAAVVAIDGINQTTNTNIMGWFYFYNVPDGTYNIGAAKAGYETTIRQVTVSGRAPISVVLVLIPKKVPQSGLKPLPAGQQTSTVAKNMVFVAFAAVSQPGSSASPSGGPPPVGSQMTSLGYKAAIAAGADPFELSGFPNPAMFDFPTGTYGYETPTTFHPNSIMQMDAYEPKNSDFMKIGCRPYWVCLNSAGTKLFVANDSQQVQVYDLTGGRTLVAAIPAPGMVTDLASNPKNSLVYAAVSATSPGILVMDSQTNQALHWVSISGARSGPTAQPRAIATSPDGSILYVALATASTGEVIAINLFGYGVMGSTLVGQMPMGIAITPNGQSIYVSNYNLGDVTVLDAASLSVVGRIRVGVQPTRVSASPNGRKVYVANNGSNNLSVIDTVVNRVINTIPTGRSPMAVAVACNGERVFVTNNGDGTVTVIDGTADKPIQTTTASTTSRPFGIATRQ